MDLHLHNKVIVVSGGAKGIGRAIVTSLLEEGAVPFVIDKDENACGELKKKHPAISFCLADLSQSSACENAIQQAASINGTIYGLVNNAGINDGVGLTSGNPMRFRESLLRNAGHVYDLTHFALSHLQKSGGSIVNIASKVAVTGQGNTSGYAAAKGAILALTREWAVELLPHKVRVNAILPAEVWTPLYESWISTFQDPEAKKKSIENKIPLGKRMTQASEIADSVLFLLSDRSSHITGQWMSVDGGYVHLDRSLS